MNIRCAIHRQIPTRSTSRAGKVECTSCCIRDTAACRGLPDDALAEVNALSHRKAVPQGGVILREGDPVSWCGLIVSGVVKLVKTASDGRQQIVCLQFAGEFLGAPFEENWRFSAEAATDVDICCFPQASFEAIRRRYAGLEAALLQDCMGSLDAAREWMFVLGRKTAEEKLASFLVFIADRLGANGGEMRLAPAGGRIGFEGLLPLSRTEIAQFLGLRIETVSRQFKKLKATGVVDTIGNRRIRIFDMDELRRLSESEAA